MNYSENTKSPIQRFQERREQMRQRFKKNLLFGVLLAFVTGVLCGVVFCRAAAEKPVTATVEPEAPILTGPVQAVRMPEPEPAPIITVEPEPEAQPEGPVLLGTYRITAYCSCEQCCGKWAKNRPDGIVYGAASIPLNAGVSCAAPTLPFGTKITVEGLGDYVVQDRPAQWVIDRFGEEQIDIYFDSHSAAEAFGLQYLNVYLKEDVKA